MLIAGVVSEHLILLTFDSCNIYIFFKEVFH